MEAGRRTVPGTVTRRGFEARIRSTRSVVAWSFGSPTIAVRPPYARDDVALRHGLRRVVRALRMDVRRSAQRGGRRGVLVEENDGVDAAERGDDLGALRLRERSGRTVPLEARTD